MIFSPTLLAGRTILVTGASSGIGRHTAIALAHSGAKLIITGRDEGRLDQTKSMLQGDVHHAYARSLDDQDDVTEWVKEMALEHSGLDGIFHAAGNALVRPTRMTKAKQVHELLAGSLLAGLGIARAASMKDVMREQGGAIVFMSSVASGRGQSGMAAYSAAKAAIEGMVRSLACEFAPKSIRVNAIAAGAVATKMHDQLMIGLTEAAQSAYESKHLLGFGAPDDIAAVATFLLSDAARWVTGATWLVDGGYSAR